MIRNIIVVKMPNTADTPAASSSFAIPKNAGTIITQKINQMAVKISPFFREKKVLLPFEISASCGRNPPFSISSATIPS